MFYAMRQDLALQRCVTGFPSIEVSFQDGKIIDESQIRETIIVKGMFDANTPPGHFESGKIPVFSNKLIDVLRSGGVDNLQTFPAVVVGEDGTEWTRYQAVQIIGLVRCANLDERIISYPRVDDSMPPLCVFRELEVDPENVPDNLKLFRLAEQPSVLIINDELLQWLIDNKPAGGWNILCDQVSD